MRTSLFNLNVDNLSKLETLQRIEEFVSSGSTHQHAVINVNKVIKAARDSDLRKIINNCDLINVDGIPLVWASRLLRKPIKERVAGIDLFLSLIEMANKQNWSLFFLGAKDETLNKTIEILRGKFPSLRISGYRNGYWNEAEEGEIAKKIRNLHPDILFVGISSPKKEYFLSKYLSMMKIPFAMGVGGAFDILSGKTKRAPLWMQNRGLEWFFRFIQEPRRLFRRYFIEGFSFLGILLKELFKLSKSP